MGFAAEVAHCLYLCGETYRKGDKGATNDMLVRSMEKQGWAALLRAARAAKREDGAHPLTGTMISGTTQLIRAAMQNDLPRVLQLVQLGAPLGLADTDLFGWTALHWACRFGHKRVARALLDGKFEGRGAKVDARDGAGCTPLIVANFEGQRASVRLLLARGARQELQDSDGGTALHAAVQFDHVGTVAILCAAPGAAAALALRDSEGRTPLGMAVAFESAACAAVLRAHGAPLSAGARRRR
jgi:ankyrin repeat protein